MKRLWRAFRRVGVRGILGDLRWRLRSVAGGRSPLQLTRASLRILRTQGPRGLVSRVRYLRTQLASPTSQEVERAPHPWLTTFAHMAAFDEFFDLDDGVLRANRRITDAFEDRPTAVASATWFLPYFTHALFGGVHTILRLMAYMTVHHGVEHRLVVFDRHNVSDRDLRSAITAVFPELSGIDIVLPVDGAVPYEELPPTDIAVCTMWISAFPLARFNATRAKFYMVQDFEPAFYPAGTLYALAEATYRLGFAGLVNTPGLLDVYASYGNPAVGFVPATASLDTSSPKPSSRRGNPVQIVVYGRPSTERNAFELIASSCRRLKDKYGDAVRIVAAGEEWDETEFGLDGIIENRGLLSTLEDVQRLYLESDIGVCFMLSKHPSYQPFEYLAAGAVPVVNVNPATGWFLRDEENCLIVEPYPSQVAAALARLVDDEALRARLASAGKAFVTSTSWDEQLASLWTYITNADGRDGAR